MTRIYFLPSTFRHSARARQKFYIEMSAFHVDNGAAACFNHHTNFYSPPESRSRNISSVENSDYKMNSYVRGFSKYATYYNCIAVG